MQWLKHVPPETMQFLVFGMWASDAFMAIGLALSGSHLTGLLFRFLARRARSGGTIVGIRAAAPGSSTSLRLGALLAVLVVLFMGMLSFFNLLQRGDQSDWSKAVGSGRRVPVVVQDWSGLLDVSDVRTIAPRGGVAMAVEVPRKGNDLVMVFADCADLGILAGREVDECAPGPTWLRVEGVSDGPRLRPGAIKVPGLGVVQLPNRDAVSWLPENMPYGFDGAILLSRERGDQLDRGELSATYFLISTSDDLAVTLAKLSGLSPGMTSDLGELSRYDPDEQQFFAYTQWLTVGAAVGLMIGGLALAVVVTGENQERRTALRGLSLLGAPGRELWRAHFWASGMPLVFLGWAGVLVGLVAAGELYAFDQRARVEFGVAIGIAFVIVIVAVLIAAVTFPSARRGALSESG